MIRPSSTVKGKTWSGEITLSWKIQLMVLGSLPLSLLSPSLSYTIRIENLAVLAEGNPSAGLRLRRDGIWALLPTVLREAPSSAKVGCRYLPQRLGRFRELICLRGLAQDVGSVSVCSLPSTPSFHMFTATPRAGIPFKLSAANLLQQESWGWALNRNNLTWQWLEGTAGNRLTQDRTHPRYVREFKTKRNRQSATS